VLRAFEELSARLGNAPGLVQGAGGNTSIKIADTLWVKASGKWLSEAAREDIFVGLDLAAVRARIAAGQGDQLADTVTSPAKALRPSIETTLHALLPHAVVLHVHSVRAIAYAVRRDAHAALTECLSGLRWALVPYRRPGLPLTEAVREALGAGPVDVLVLGNHGLVVGGKDCVAAEALLNDVERRLDGFRRAEAPPDLDGLAQTGFRLPQFEEAHRLAASPASVAIAGTGTLYPDHVVFLGSGAAVWGSQPTRAEPAPADPAILIVPGKGVLVRDGLSAGAEEMVRALALVVERIPDGADIAYLSRADEAALLNWDAEKYRKSLQAS
jgi:rhamnose utilization protein RhaD (predicted bifunctional aldolase and dehydrogenase)